MQDTVYKTHSQLTKFVIGLLLCLFVSHSETSFAETRDEVLQKIQKSHGTVVPENSMPVLYDRLREDFQKLSLAQADLTKSHVSTSEVHVLDSDVVNAFVVVAREQGKQRARNIVFVTTAMLKVFFPEGLSDSEFEGHLLALVGVMSHELGHPADKLDGNNSIENHYGNLQGSQAIEIRADTEAIRILRKAGFPTDLLYRSMKILLAHNKKQNTVLAGADTHPQTDVRLTNQEILMTVDDPREGDQSTPLPPTPREEIDQSLHELYGWKRRILLPYSVDELYQNTKSSDNLRKISNKELNLWLLWLDAEMERNPTLLETSYDKLNSIRKSYMQAGVEICKNQDCLKRLFEGTTGTESLPYKLHAEYVKTLPFYNESGIEDIPVLPNDKDVYSWFSESLIERGLSQRLHGPEDYWKFYTFAIDNEFTNRSGFVPADFVQHAANFHQKALHLFKAEPDLIFTRAVVFLYLLPTVQSRNYWNDLLRRQQSPEIQQKTKQILQSIWENRGFWSYMEFITDSDISEGIDWDFIVGRLGIDRSQYKNLILSEFKKFVRDRYSNPDVTKNYKGQIANLVELNLRTHRPVWINDSVISFLKGVLGFITEVPPVEHQPNPRERFSALWLRTAYYFFPDKISPEYKRSFRAALDQLSTEELQQPRAIFKAADQAMVKSFGTTGVPILNKNRLMDSWLVVRDSPMPDASKKEFLKSLLFLRDGGQYQPTSIEIDMTNKESLTFLFAESVRLGITTGFLDYFNRINQIDRSLSAGYAKISPRLLYSKLADVVVQELQSRLQNPQLTAQEFLRLVDGTSLALEYQFKPGHFPTSTKIVKLFLGKVGAYNLTARDKLLFFTRLTSIGTSSDSDAFFKKELQAEIVDHRDGKTLSRLLKEDRFESQEYHVALAKPQVLSQLHGNVDLFNMNDQVNKLIPTGSNPKDKFIESLAWQLNITSRELSAHVEDEKMTNWARLNPSWINLSSTLTAAIAQMSTTERLQLVEYLIKADQKAEAPPRLLEIVEKDLLSAINKVDRTKGALVAEKVHLKLAQFKQDLESMTRDSNPLQRSPLIKIALASASVDLTRNSTVYAYLIQHYLEMETDSIESAAVNAYLDSVPEYSRAIILSYFLANAGQEGAKTGYLKAILENSFGTIGIKFGQAAALFNIFDDPKYQEELEDLLDHSTPMSKAEIESVLKLHLSEVEQGQLELKEILGSASVKTVIFAKHANGEKLALMVKRPKTENQIQWTLALAKRFLARLEYYSAANHHPLFHPLVNAIEDQIFHEIDFRNEAENYEKVSAIIDDINGAHSIDMQGWTLSSPKVSKSIPISSDLYAVEAIEGSASARSFFKDANVSAKDKETVGRIIAESSLQFLLRYGYFDPDRHGGNWLIDLKGKKVHFIDPGQLVHFSPLKNPFKWDPRMTLSFFLKAMNDKDSNAIAHYAALMTKDGQVSDQVKAKAVKNINAVLADSSLTSAKQIQEIVVALYKSGYDLKNMWWFGALKGLMVLASSNYVSEGVFKDILTSEIKTLLFKKAPAVVATKLTETIQKAAPHAAVAPLCRDLF